MPHTIKAVQEWTKQNLFHKAIWDENFKFLVKLSCEQSANPVLHMGRAGSFNATQVAATRGWDSHR